MDLACTVVIPTYNGAATLGEQLAALSRQDVTEPFEVVVADNGSTDDLAAVTRAWESELDLRVVDASARRGPSAARNIGAADARSPRLLFCDADDVVSEGWVRSLTSGLEHHDFVGGPYLTFATRKGIWLPGYDTSALPTAWDACAYAFGGNFGVTASLWHRLGGFDETLTGAEEIEFAWRAREIGVEPVLVPEAVVAYRVRDALRGRLWHEYNSGRGTAMLANRLVPDTVTHWSRRSQARRYAMLVSRFPRSTDGGRWAAWLATLAFEAGRRAGDGVEA